MNGGQWYKVRKTFSYTNFCRMIWLLNIYAYIRFIIIVIIFIFILFLKLKHCISFAKH